MSSLPSGSVRRTSSRLARSATSKAVDSGKNKKGESDEERLVKRRKVQSPEEATKETTVATKTTKVEQTVIQRKRGATAVVAKKVSNTTTNTTTIDEDDHGSCCSHEEAEKEDDGDAANSEKENKRKKSIKAKKAEQTEEDEAVVKTTRKPAKKDTPMTGFDTIAMWARAEACQKYVGAHVSGAGGCYHAIENSVDIGGTAMALFVRNQRKWTSPPMASTDITQFATSSSLSKHSPLKHMLPHGSYLINLAQRDAIKAAQAYDAFVDELQRCEQLGIGLYNFHPGSALKEPKDEAIQRISDAINRSHKATSFVVVVIENMAGQGNIIGGTFEDLRDIINGVEDKKRVGVCIDTCHTFASGYDLRTEEAYTATMAQFEKTVGMSFLRGIHLNDSKEGLGSKKDRHENLGKGQIGWECFRLLMNDPRMNNIPMVLETPVGKDSKDNGHAIYRREISQLYSLVGKATGFVPS
ncbi:hypothetical protein PhCBS80983_g01802 [Powellomyces hirtus]|uniref:Apurinic-apyrimidinic endonuclease 1 n=1 Tax=Powellomyces hirtus TaxID=109895 RepID=A0A507EAH8_9FUNG|nr:hypothetical protein PhCBS80983_g01802 [Powellomyces hirtus]